MNSYALMLGCVYLGIVNIVTFVICAIDKRRAGRGASRVPESTLLGLALVGGALGALLAMLSVRHKTQKWYFMYTVPVMLAVQIALVAWAFIEQIS